MVIGVGGWVNVWLRMFECVFCRRAPPAPSHQSISSGNRPQSSPPFFLSYLVKAEVQHVLHALRLHPVEQAAGDGHGAVDLRAAGVVELDAVVAQGDDVVAAAFFDAFIVGCLV